MSPNGRNSQWAFNHCEYEQDAKLENFLPNHSVFLLGIVQGEGKRFGQSWRMSHWWRLGVWRKAPPILWTPVQDGVEEEGLERGNFWVLSQNREKCLRSPSFSSGEGLSAGVRGRLGQMPPIRRLQVEAAEPQTPLIGKYHRPGVQFAGGAPSLMWAVQVSLWDLPGKAFPLLRVRPEKSHIGLWPGACLLLSTRF